MLRLAQMRPIVRLQDLLTGVADQADDRSAARAVMGEDIQRLFLGPQWLPRDRLELLTDLARTAMTGPLPLRERELVVAEVSRLAVRILWSEGLFGDALTPEAAPTVAASRLLELAASDMLPEGPAFRIVMKRAKDLLQRHDVAAQVAADADLRHRLQDQLDRAEERLTIVAV